MWSKISHESSSSPDLSWKNFTVKVLYLEKNFLNNILICKFVCEHP